MFYRKNHNVIGSYISSIPFSNIKSESAHGKNKYFTFGLNMYFHLNSICLNKLIHKY